MRQFYSNRMSDISERKWQIDFLASKWIDNYLGF